MSILLGLIVFCLSLATFVFGYQLWYAGRIFPGVRVAGISVGGMTPEQAAEAVAQEMRYPTQGKIILRDGEQLWVSTPAELGLYLDPLTSARSAYRVGRSAAMVENLKTQYAAWQQGREIPPALVLDERAIDRRLSAIAQEVDLPMIEATLAIKDAQVSVTPGRIGRSVDKAVTIEAVSAQLQTLKDGVVDVKVNDNMPVILDATQQAELARSILSAPLTFSLPAEDKFPAGPWTIEPSVLAGMLTFERVEAGDGKQQYQVNFQTNKLRQYLAELAPALATAPRNPRFIFNDDTRKLEVIENAVIGRSLNIEDSIQSIQQNLSEGKHTVALVVNYENPDAIDDTSGEALGITELVHSETSYFYGSSAARVQNITTAASKFHGVLVAPGEVFSMASVIGDITLDNGYAEALIIAGGQTITGVGGGVCQVSTTLFRAAFFTGFPIVERYAHAYRVYYYEKVAGNRIDTRLAGLDATVFVPIVDFKFTNDTPYWLLMETYVNPAASSITWKFYSTSDGRSVDWTTSGVVNVVSPPPPVYRENPELPSGTIKQVDWAADGADVVVKRTVMRGGGIYLSDTISTHYQPWQDAYEYGPGTEIPTDDTPVTPEG